MFTAVMFLVASYIFTAVVTFHLMLLAYYMDKEELNEKVYKETALWALVPVVNLMILLLVSTYLLGIHNLLNELCVRIANLPVSYGKWFKTEFLEKQ